MTGIHCIPIMAGQHPTLAEASQSNPTGSSHADFAAPTSRRDSTSSNSSSHYQPLPEGLWTIPFHGNCPKCSHHHRAAQVKIKVTQDEGQINRVNCEKCGVAWAAFGGRNATVISLLSTTSTEPDSMAEEVRLRLIDVVLMATQRATSSLVALPEQPSSPPFEEPLVGASSRSAPDARDISLISSAHRAVDGVGPSTQADHQPPQIAPCPTATSSTGFRRRLSKLKKKLTTRFPILHRTRIQQIITGTKKSAMTPRQIEKSPVHVTNNADRQVFDNDITARASSPEGIDFVHATQVTLSEADARVPAVRLTDVASFIRGLDKSGLKTMTDKEKTAWLRQHYTEFKRRPKRQTPLSISEIFESSIHPYPRAEYCDGCSLDLRAIGALFEELDRVGSSEESQRWDSLSVSDVFSEASTAHDAITVASFPRYSRHDPLQRVRERTPRPLSLPDAAHSLPHIRHRFRNSLPPFLHNGAGDNSTTRGQESVRFSR